MCAHLRGHKHISWKYLLLQGLLLSSYLRRAAHVGMAHVGAWYTLAQASKMELLCHAG